MEWSDTGIVLSARRHGEAAAVVSILTETHGRHAGLVRGGASRRHRSTVQPSNRVAATWRARLEDHLGAYVVELLESPAAHWFDDPGRLAALSSACGIVDATLPEREPCESIYNDLSDFFGVLNEDGWPAKYVAWELTLLADLGFGLDLGHCAVTGTTEDLAYVSPKSGRAVSVAAAEPYRDRLLRLPAFLSNGGPACDTAVADGLALTGYFLDRHLFAPHRRKLPEPRSRLQDRLRRKSSAESE